LRRTRGNDVVIFNQFEEFGNSIWHYQQTGGVIEEIYQKHYKTSNSRLSAFISATGSAGTVSAGDFLRTCHPHIKVVACEATQCPTLYQFGFGAHRIEGIGDKHIPWVHNVKNTDMAIAIDDDDSMALLRLFNEPAGKEYLKNEIGICEEDVESLALMGISGISNMLCAIKFAKYYELTNRDVVATILTDSVEMYLSRLEEQRGLCGGYTTVKAAADYAASLRGAKTDNLIELTYTQRKRIHNLKYYTWVEQQGRLSEELDDQWYRQDKTFEAVQKQTEQIDALIDDFNERVGLTL
jgi:hypothetical protein